MRRLLDPITPYLEILSYDIAVEIHHVLEFERALEFLIDRVMASVVVFIFAIGPTIVSSIPFITRPEDRFLQASQAEPKAQLLLQVHYTLHTMHVETFQLACAQTGMSVRVLKSVDQKLGVAGFPPLLQGVSDLIDVCLEALH